MKDVFEFEPATPSLDIQFANYLSGKRVAIVGRCLIHDIEQGAFIDSHDVVVRVHQAAPYSPDDAKPQDNQGDPRNDPVEVGEFVPSEWHSRVGKRVDILYPKMRRKTFSDDRNGYIRQWLDAVRASGVRFICRDVMSNQNHNEHAHLAGASKLVDDYPASHYTEHNVHSTKRLRELYPDRPLYLASTTDMYNDKKQIDHKHPYTRSKYEAEDYADVVFRMGTINGVNRAGNFDFVIDLMIDGAITKKEIVVAQGATMLPIAGLTYICMMYYRAVANGVFAERAKREGARVIQHLYETCQSIENIGTAVHRALYALPQERYDAAQIKFIRQNDLRGIVKQSPAISSIPPDFQPNPVYEVHLFRLVMECVERCETYGHLQRGQATMEAA